jgi:hypothetical protein
MLAITAINIHSPSSKRCSDPCACYEGIRRSNSTTSLTQWSTSRLARFTAWYPLNQELGGIQNRSGRFGEHRKPSYTCWKSYPHHLVTTPTELLRRNHPLLSPICELDTSSIKVCTLNPSVTSTALHDQEHGGKILQLMLYKEIIAVCSQIHTKHINTLCGLNEELFNVKSRL